MNNFEIIYEISVQILTFCLPVIIFGKNVSFLFLTIIFQFDKVDKVIQLYEVMMTRHSTMIIGPTGGGKTVVIETLCKAQTRLGMPTKLYTLNPKVSLRLKDKSNP